MNDYLEGIHPGEILEDLLNGAEITQSAFAKHIRVTPGYVNSICRGKRNISPEMAIKISQAIGGNAAHWLRLQNSWNLFEAQKKMERTGAPEIELIEIAA